MIYFYAKFMAKGNNLEVTEFVLLKLQASSPSFGDLFSDLLINVIDNTGLIMLICVSQF